MPTIKQVTEVIGILVSNFPGPLHYRNVERDKYLALVLNKGNYEGKIQLSPMVLQEIRWWLNKAITLHRDIQHPPSPSVTIQSHASKLGSGAVLGAQKTGGRWTPFETESHIKSKERDQLAFQIWEWCITRHIWLSAVHIAGRLNTGADEKSRVFSDNHEWLLNKQLFDDILSHHPGLDCDLFASRLNFQIGTYCSWRGDPHSAQIHAFTMNWSGYKFYAFPPFSLLPKCLQKIRQDRAHGILIAHSSLANIDVVSSPATIPLRSTLDSASTPGSSETPLTQSTPPAAQETPPNGMSCVRGAFSRYKLSEEVTDVLMAPWRSGTQKQYRTYLNKWMPFCDERKIAYYSPLLNEALQFLVRLFNQGLSYSALNTARSALSAIIITEGGESFGTNRVVTRFMKGVFESRRPNPKYTKIWDVGLVLKHLSTLFPYDKLALKDLTYKVLMLILLVSSQRRQTVHSLDLTPLCVEEDKCIFYIDEHIKTSSPIQKSK